MFRSSRRLSSRAFIALTLSGATLSAAGAATFHRLAVGQTTGSNGSTTFLQSGTGSALQGEVATSANTSIKYPFGVLGEFDPSGSTFGIGTLGVSSTGYGVAGESTTNQPSILAYSGGAGIGLEAVASQNTAILGQTAGLGYGVEGTDTAVEGYDSPQEAGVYGEDLSSPSPGSLDYSSGVIGETRHGYTGVYGVGDTGSTIGVTGFSTTGTGVLGITDTSSTSSGSVAVEAMNKGTSGDGVDSISANGEAFNGTAGNNSALALYNKSASSAYPTIQLYQAGTTNMIAAGSPNGAFIVDNAGDITISGSVSSKAASRQLTQNPSTDVMSYSAEATQPTIEDVGSAHLLNGSAMVPLAADYRQTIDGSSYMVFLTPNGQSHGLYVASKSPAGFVVRENDGGRSTLAFDYRIVAQQYGEHDGRLPHFASIHPDLTKELANMRSQALKQYEESRAKLTVARKQSALIRAAMLRRHAPQTPPNPLPASLAKH